MTRRRPVRSRWLWLAAAAAGACGTAADRPTGAAQHHYALDDVAGDRVIVATVNDRPVYGDCVAQQASANRLDAATALEQCVRFELLAQEAERRGYLDDPEVQATAKRESVRALLGREYPYRAPQETPDEVLAALWEREKLGRYNHPELRTTAFCRAAVAEDAAPGSPEDQRAKEAMAAVYAYLRTQKNLDIVTFDEHCQRLSKDQQVQTQRTQTFSRTDAYEEHYRAATFAIDEVGMVSPPVRTKWGWDIILLTELRAPRTTAFEEAADELRDVFYWRPEFERDRQAVFARWFAPMADKHQVEVFADRLPHASELVPPSQSGEGTR